MRLLPFIGLVFFLLHGAVFAAEAIPSFDARITVHEDASVEVAERIVYDFGNAEGKHGIFRTIPYSYQARSNTYTASISNVLVYDKEGRPLPFSESKGNGELTLKIGDPNVTVAGEYTYIITYLVKGPFLYMGSEDEFYWNVTGSWERPIAHASVLVDLPKSAKVLGAACYQGTVGANTRCTKDERLVNAEQAGYTATADGLAPREGFSIAVAFPKGTIAKIETPSSEVYGSPYTYVPFVLPIVVLLGMLYVWYTRGRDPEGWGTVMPQYEPPKGVPPSVAGIVYNERIEPREISAEIIRLAVEGYIKIHHLDTSARIFATTDYLFERVVEKAPQDDIVANSILTKLFKSEYAGEGEVAGKKVQGSLLSKMRHTFASDRTEITEVLYDEVFVRGYFLERPDIVRNWYVGSGAALLVAGIAGVVFAPEGIFSMLGAAVALSGVPVLLVGTRMPVKTRAGVELKEYLEGFKRYLSVAEKDRLAFHSAPEKKPELFDAFLPYAMAFGVEKAWAEQFKDMHVPEPTWYSGTTGDAFVPAIFVSHISAFSTDFATASMPSSSGAGGGGSVGGGFGGGGGGSW